MRNFARAHQSPRPSSVGYLLLCRQPPRRGLPIARLEQFAIRTVALAAAVHLFEQRAELRSSASAASTMASAFSSVRRAMPVAFAALSAAPPLKGGATCPP